MFATRLMLCDWMRLRHLVFSLSIVWVFLIDFTLQADVLKHLKPVYYPGHNSPTAEGRTHLALSCVWSAFSIVYTIPECIQFTTPENNFVVIIKYFISSHLWSVVSVTDLPVQRLRILQFVLILWTLAGEFSTSNNAMQFGALLRFCFLKQYNDYS